MIEAPLALAFGAGMVATVNPCGFAMLPAYLSYFIGLDDGAASRVVTVRRALVIGGVMSSAFLLVFGATGALITAGFRVVIDWIPWVALLIGVAVGILGIAMLGGFEPVVSLPKAKRARRGDGLRSVFAFGLSYALASLSCTLPVFLTVVASQVTTSNFLSGLATFLAYGLGMALVLLSLTVGMALGKQSLVRRLRGSVRYVNRAAGAILVLAGTYIVWFWGTNLTSGADALGGNGVFEFIERLSQRAFEVVGDNITAWGLVLGGIVVASLVYVLLRTPTATVEDGAAPASDERLVTAAAGDE